MSKPADAGKEFLGDSSEEGFAYPGAKASLKISLDQIKNRAWFEELIHITAKHAPTPKPKKKK